MILRIGFFLVLVASTVIFPLPFVLGLFVLLVAFFDKFWEGILTGFFLDAFYPSPLFFEKLHLGFFTIGFLAIFFLLELVKSFVQSRNLFSKFIVAVSGGVAFFVLFLIFT